LGKKVSGPVIPEETLEIVLTVMANYRRGVTAEVVARETKLSPEEAEKALRFLRRKRQIDGPAGGGKYFLNH